MIEMTTDNCIRLSLADETDTAHETEIREPSMYRVIMHNDHYTTMEFVVMVLMSVFHKSEEEASRLMLQIHNSGSAVCGVYILDIAQTKVNHVHSLARREEYPLKCSIEEV